MPIGRLPNLLVAGVPKAGTGSLFAYLTQHPEICRGDQKEVGFLNYYNPQRHQGEPPPLESYMKHYARCGDQRYALDATPTYSYGGKPVIEAAQRLLQPKVIITLRDPVDRMWSAYTFQRTLGNITGLDTFDAYLNACKQRRRDGSDLVPRDHMHGLYIGYYADYLGDWLDSFGDDIRVVFTDQLAREPAAVVGSLFQWLDIDPTVAEAMDLAPRNKTKHARSPRVAKAIFTVKRSVDKFGRLPPALRGPIRRAYERVNGGELPERLTPDMRQQVEDLYRASNQATAKLLTAHGYRDLPQWLQVAAVRD